MEPRLVLNSFVVKKDIEFLNPPDCLQIAKISGSQDHTLFDAALVNEPRASSMLDKHPNQLSSIFSPVCFVFV